MVKLIEMMLDEHLIAKESIATLVRRRPPVKVSFENLLNEKMVDFDTLETFLVKKLRDGVITLEHLEKIEGINITPILKRFAAELHISYVDLDEIDMDMSLFSKIPYKQLLKVNAIPVSENDINVLVAFADALDMGARDAMQRIFPRKPMKIALARPSQINKRLQQLELTESIKGLVDDIRKDLATAGKEEKSDESPAVMKLIEIILKSAIIARASDIHVEATEKNCGVRNRIDGMLIQGFVFEKDIFPLSPRDLSFCQIWISLKKESPKMEDFLLLSTAKILTLGFRLFRHSLVSRS